MSDERTPPAQRRSLQAQLSETRRLNAQSRERVALRLAEVRRIAELLARR